MIESLKSEKDFVSALISVLSRSGAVPSRDDVEAKAKKLSVVFEYNGDLTQAIDRALIAIVTRMGLGVSLFEKEADHDDQWMFRREIKPVYAEAYEDFLRREGWAPEVVQALSDTGTKILGHLQDPLSEGTWKRRGLVIGHVQSGKTANYMGLVAKAADAGYRFIIVVAGIHNNLRRQTQERIDEALIGRSSDPASRRLIGVGLSGDYPHPVTLTNIYDDFSKATAAKAGWQLNDFRKPIVLVIKKNVKTLVELHGWLKDLNARSDGKIDAELLMIDDEADNASINTNKEDLSPTRTNSMLRQILGLFAKSCYVGYTATPFANIFINPDAYDKLALDELFPRHFIYSLDAPTTYFGPDRVFLDEGSSEKILRRITDCENYLPASHKRDDPIMGLPPSLYTAINEFIVARAIRNLRGQARKHCSMMINVSRFVPVQRTVRDLVSVYEKKLREAVAANYAMREAASSGNVHMQALKAVYEKEFGDSGTTWAEVKAGLAGVFENLRLFVINSKSDEALDYRKYENEDQGLTAIAIGGLSLSRGLTIEGLTVSYMYRNTKMYDTLMQMGRWFGYRTLYDDLCRVHLSKDSIEWYSHIGNASEELRDQIRSMRRDGLTPRQFGLYVLAHPDSPLLVTAKNKMRSGEHRTVHQSYSGQLIETTVLPKDDATNLQNEELIAEAWKSGFGTTLEPTSKGWLARDVPISQIEAFLKGFKVHSAIEGRKTAAISYLRKVADLHPLGDILLISIEGNQDDPSAFRLGRQERSSAETHDRFENAWHASRDRIASRGDEKLGLNDVQREAAEAEAKADNKQVADRHYRRQRGKPLLMLHVLGPLGDKADARVPAFGVSFPYGDYDKTIEVYVNKVWLELFGDLTPDDPDLEEDFDV